MRRRRLPLTLLVFLALAVSSCRGAPSSPTSTATPRPPTTTPTASPTPRPTRTPTPGPCAGEWVGTWTQVEFETNTGGIRLPTYSITGKRLVLKDDCSYQEDWSEEASDIGCESSGLIEGEYTLGDELIQFTASDVLTEIELDCGGGGQISGSAATDGLHEVPSPGYALDPSALPDELRLTASFVTEQGFNITVTQAFTRE